MTRPERVDIHVRDLPRWAWLRLRYLVVLARCRVCEAMLVAGYACGVPYEFALVAVERHLDLLDDLQADWDRFVAECRIDA